MANKIPASVTRHPWGNAQVDKMGAVGVTAEEMKVRTGAGLPAPEVGPIAQAGPMEFINPTRSSDNLRLAVPNTENPFTTPMGPQHDYVLVASAINRSRSSRSADLVKMLQDPPGGFKDEVVTQNEGVYRTRKQYDATSGSSSRHATGSIWPDIGEPRGLDYPIPLFH